MAVTIAKQQTPSDTYSSGTFLNPLCFTFDGVRGGSEQVQMLVTNTDLSNAINNVTVAIGIPANSPAATFLTIELRLNDGLPWQQAPVNLGTLAAGESATLWAKLTVQEDTSVQNIKNLIFRVLYDE